MNNQNPKESKWEWMVEIRRIMVKYSRNGRFHKSGRPSSRMMRRVVRNDQQSNDNQQGSTSQPSVFKIFVPNNDDRFDSWGG